MSKQDKRWLTFIIIIILTLGTLAIGNSQNHDRFTLSAYTEPQHFISVGDWQGDGFNIGFAIEYQMPQLMYFKAQTYFFPNLNGIDYADIEGVVGVQHRKTYDDWRYYAGIKGGMIYREGLGAGKFGFEVGIEYYFVNGFFIGIQPSSNLRADGGVWGQDEKNYWGFDVGIKIGIIL